MKRYAKYILIFVLCGAVSVFVYYWKIGYSENKNKLPDVCGENENPVMVEELSINQVWESRGDIPKTINEDNSPAHYQEWRLTDNSKVRVIEERYANWGLAHEAIGKRLKNAQDVCQRGQISHNGSLIDSKGYKTRVISKSNDKEHPFSVEILIARECEEIRCSFLTIIQAQSLAHALAKEEAYGRIDY